MAMHVNEGVLELNGEVNFDNVVDILKESLDVFPSLPTITIDLKNLTKSDSSGLALLVAWMRRARAEKKNIKFLNMHSFMQDLARVSGLNKLLSGK